MEGEKWLDSRGMYPASDEPVVLDSTEAAELAQQISDSKTTLKMTEQEIAAAEERLKELMGIFTLAKVGNFIIKWPVRSYKYQPEKVVPAKEAYSIRQSTLTIKEEKQ